LPDVESLKSEPTLEYVKAGRPGMYTRPQGVPGGADSFALEAKQRGE